MSNAEVNSSEHDPIKEMGTADDNDLFDMWVSIKADRITNIPGTTCNSTSPSAAIVLQALQSDDGEEYIDPFMEQVNALVQERELEASERARKLRLRELWKEAWSSVDLTPPHIPLLQPPPTGTATPPSDTIHSISPLATLISPVSTPTTCPSVPSHSAGEEFLNESDMFDTESSRQFSSPSTPLFSLPTPSESSDDSPIVNAVQKQKKPKQSRRKQKKKKTQRTANKTYAYNPSSWKILDDTDEDRRTCDICGEYKSSNFRPVISDWIGKQRLIPDDLRVMSCNPCYCNHSKNNPDWNKMKICMLKTQLRRFLDAGITHAELRLGFGSPVITTELNGVKREIEQWIEGRCEMEVEDSELMVRPCLPACWDSPA